MGFTDIFKRPEAALLLASAFSADPNAPTRALQGLTSGQEAAYQGRERQRKELEREHTRNAIAEIMSMPDPSQLDWQGLASRYPEANTSVVMPIVNERLEAIRQGRKENYDAAMSALKLFPQGSQLPQALVSQLPPQLQTALSGGKVPGMSPLEELEAKKRLEAKYREPRQLSEGDRLWAQYQQGIANGTIPKGTSYPAWYEGETAKGKGPNETKQTALTVNAGLVAQYVTGGDMSKAIKLVMQSKGKGRQEFIAEVVRNELAYTNDPNEAYSKAKLAADLIYGSDEGGGYTGGDEEGWKSYDY